MVVVVIFEGFRYGVSWSCLKLPKQATSDFLPVQHERENTGVELYACVCVVTTYKYEYSNLFTNCCCEYLSFEKSAFTTEVLK